MHRDSVANITCVYSPVYDGNFSSASGVVLTEKEIAEGYQFVDLVNEHWKKMAPACDYLHELGFLFPEKTLAYAVNPRGNFTPFFDPLTFHINSDIHDVLATLIHEFCHVIFLSSLNDRVADVLWKKVDQAFSEENLETKDHIIINKLTEVSLKKVWDTPLVSSVLNKERVLPSLGRAWKIWDDANIVSDDAVTAISILCSQKNPVHEISHRNP